jgi:quercetin dioxygenase-like cupin family protein
LPRNPHLPYVNSGFSLNFAFASLYSTSGEGRVQSKGQSVQTVKAGDVVWTPPFVEHWHGGGFETSMSHIAISEPVDGEAVVWLNAVSEAEYRGDK